MVMKYIKLSETGEKTLALLQELQEFEDKLTTHIESNKLFDEEDEVFFGDVHSFVLDATSRVKRVLTDLIKDDVEESIQLEEVVDAV